jgi:hypothetical protein
MDEIAERWMIKTAVSNQYRMASWYDLDDLIQDGYMIWRIVVKKYPHARDRAHRMALFQSSYRNHINDLAKGERAVPEAWSPEVEAIPCSQAELAQYVAELPALLRTAVAKLEARASELAFPYRIRRNGTRETGNERFCRLIGLDHRRVDVHTLLRELRPHSQ